MTETSKDIYYEKNNILIRRTKPSDVDFLANRLRSSDVAEILASHNQTPYRALIGGLSESVLTLTVEYKGEAVGMFGINPEHITGNRATIWMLCSDSLDKIRKSFIKDSRKFIDIFLGLYSYLENYVDVRNKKSIAWLKMCGATIEEAKPYGYFGLPFRRFYFERG